MKNFLTKSKFKITLVLIILLASLFRLYGLDWDQGQHLHPDERFLTMVTAAMKIPGNFPDYLNPKVSTMNPYNLNFSFFVYGTFPLNLTRIAGEFLNKTDYWNVHFVGRVLSALFDVGVVFFVYLITKKIYGKKEGLLASFLYSIMVLPIQLSHFYTVDTFLNFFIMLSFFLLLEIQNTKHPISDAILLGVSFGLALACKISALYFAPIVTIGFLIKLVRDKKYKSFILNTFFIILTSLLVFRLNQPTAFASGSLLDWKINPQFISNLKELSSYNDPGSWFPPAVQWKTTTPIIFPLKNLILWGMGLPLGIISLLSVIYTVFFLSRNFFKDKKSLFTQNNIIYLLSTVWIIGLLGYLGVQFCKTMRYFLPIYPFLALISAAFLSNLDRVICKKFPKRILYILYCTFYILLLFYPISFMSIYSHPITRVTASRWIYQNIPSGSNLLNEEWDDYLPLGLPESGNWTHQGEMVFMYDWDSPEKWQRINPKLEKTDYIILTSNRAYGSTMKLPSKYPQTIAYYQSLFNSTGNFKKVAEFTSRPCFPPIGKPLFCFNDDHAEEAFTVYDHPKVIIFQKK